MIHFSDVSKIYENQAALRNITFSIEKGEMAFITGPSGAGKSTILKIIYLSEKPDEGSVTIAEWELSKLKESSIPFLRRNIGVVFQDFRLLDNRNVFDN
ncbi:MAG: ATP-binding cassette domain-containing protein, partial [Thermodesulfovibrionales bacterium]